MRIQTIDSAREIVVIDDFPDQRYHAIRDGLLRIPDLGLNVRDAEPANFLTGQLAYLETVARSVDFEDRYYEQFLPGCITSEAGPWAEVVNYKVKLRSGRGKRIHPGATQVPMAGSALSMAAVPIAHGGVGYSYFLQELQAAAHNGTPLTAERQSDCIEGYLDHIDDVACIGEPESNFKGLLNHSAIDSFARNSGAVWDAALPATILNDINVLLTNVFTKSKSKFPPSHVILEPSRFALLVKPRSDQSDYTIMKYVLENNIYTLRTGKPLTIMPGPSSMATLGTGATKMMMAYTPKPDFVKFHISMPQQFIAPQQEGFEVVIYSQYRYGGLDYAKVYTAEYAYGL